MMILFQKETLADFLGKSKATALLFTHNWGGGTEQYIRNIYSADSFLIVRKVAFRDRDLFFSVEDSVSHRVVYICESELSLLFRKDYHFLVVNSLCGYSNLSNILKSCINAKINNSGMRLLYLVHDFHCVCPTIHLMYEGFYCYLQCEKLKCDFRETNYSISEWRNMWRTFLENTDEIRCFSESSKEIIMTAYPTLDRNKITVVPHDMSYSKFTPINIKNQDNPVYGVVGACQSEIKGGRVMQTILERVPENIRFVFVGTKKSKLKTNRKNVVFLGKYKQDELQQILERENVTHVIFPSVCPETFSYVVSEIMQMQLPIYCFNLGAQAEKVSKYDKGVVCESVEEMINKISTY